MMKKYSNNSYIFIFTFVLIIFQSFGLYAQRGIRGGGGLSECSLWIDGPSQLNLGQSGNFSVQGMDDSYLFSASPDGNPILNYSNGQYFVSCVWNTPGLKTLRVEHYDDIFGNLLCGEINVTIIDPCPPLPNVLNYTAQTLSDCTVALYIDNPQAGTEYRWYMPYSTFYQVGNVYTLSNAIGYSSVYLYAFKDNCLSASRFISVQFNNHIQPAVNSTSRGIFVGDNLTMSVTNVQANTNYAWYEQIGSTSNILNNNTPNYSPVVSNVNTTGRKYSVKPYQCNINNTSSPITDIMVYSYPMPSITSSNPSNNGIAYIPRGENITLSSSNAYTSYQWTRNGQPIANTNQITTTQSGVYVLTVTQVIPNSGGQTISKTLNIQLKKSAVEDQNLNYIITRNILKENVINETQIEDLNVNEIQESTTYFDGLGREMQTVMTQASPSKKDIIQPIEYDVFGRMPKNYLPYTNDNTGKYKTDALIQQASFYNVGNVLNATNNNDIWKSGNGFDLPQTLYPYNESVFEASPLNRVLEKGNAGKSWQVQPNQQGKTIKAIERTLNSAETIKIWNIGYNTTDKPIYTGDYVYDVVNGSPLWINETTDEHNNKIIEYKDKKGQLILKKVQKDATTFTETYYVYDDFGLLRYVLPPLAVEKLTQNNHIFTPEIDELVFYYRYDARKRMILKKVPSAGETHIVYDKLDKPIMTQDAKQRINNQWTITKYDILSRPALTALHNNTNNRETLQTQADNFAGNTFENKINNEPSKHWTTNNSFPVLDFNTPSNILLSATYYDNYDFNEDGSPDYSYDQAIAQNNNTFTALPFDRIQGRVTGSFVRVLNSNPLKFLVTISFYDDKGRVIQSMTENHTGGKDIVSTKYDFAGKVLRTHHYQTKITNGQTYTIQTTQRSEYDHTGKPLKNYHKVNNETEKLVSEIRYNELGQVVEKKLGQHSITGNALQTVKLRYNIRGWMTHINEDYLSSPTVSNALFAMELLYDQDFRKVDNLGKANFNGNITGQKWRSSLASDRVRSFAYEYDALNRLLNADYLANKDNNAIDEVRWFNEKLNYDVNGNILTLQRYKKNSNDNNANIVHDFVYNYNANQLKKVNNLVNPTPLAVDNMYDANGSLLSYDRKNIAAIQYNHLNLPENIIFAGNNKIENLYDAAGIKLQKRTYENSLEGDIYDYISGIVYKKDVLEFLPMPEGRVLNLNNTFVYEYQYKDHLGNLRVSFREANQVQYVASSELSNANSERTQFANVDATRSPHPTQSGQSACLTNAGKPLGLWKSMPISKGDKINAGVSAYYTQTSSMPSGINWALFPVQNPTYGNNEGGTRPFGLPFSLGVILLPNPTPSASVPVAYLRMVFYNAQNAIIQQSVRYVGGQNNLWQYYETGSIEALQNGRVEIYVVNESVPNVWFDNLTITHLPTLISQENHYYAFGMNAKEIEKEGSNRFQYNSKEKESFQGLEWNDYGARNYDSEACRWWGVDAKADEMRRFSVYNYCFNNPVRFVDPDGKKPDYFIGTDGKRVDIKNVNGRLVIGNNAPKDLQRLINYTNEAGSKIAKTAIMEAGTNETKINVKIVSEIHDKPDQLGYKLLGSHQPHSKEGKPLSWNDNTGDFNGKPEYLKGKNDTYKEATIFIFEGNIKNSPNGNGNATINGFPNVTAEQEIVRVFQHEARHDTDKEYIADSKNKREGKPNKNIDAHKNIRSYDQKFYQEITK